LKAIEATTTSQEKVERNSSRSNQNDVIAKETDA